jgi:hypothetical protein
MGSRVTDNYYKHIPETAINVNGTTIMRDISVSTDRTILAFRPDRALQDKKGKTSLLTDIATPDDANVNTKETEKPSKYKDLEFRVQQDVESEDNNCVSYNWGALGTIKK